MPCGKPWHLREQSVGPDGLNNRQYAKRLQEIVISEPGFGEWHCG
jgi:hypothetical protein